ncbi:MAG: hypothetical protein WC044_04160 [Crocinitomicaceae bacterium]
MKFLILFPLFFISTYSLFAQVDSSLVRSEKELELILTDLRNATNNSEKETKNDLFKDKLYETINQKAAFSYPFSRLKTLGSINSSDGLVRIFNWNVEQDDHSQKYYCLILRMDERKNEIQRIELTESSDIMALKPMEILAANEWYGALYYQIIPFEKGNRDMYTLLGWDGNNATSNMKIIDVLYFSGNQAKLGSPVFKVGSQTFKRLFYEYSKKSTMSLRYDEKYERILMDHLSPESPGLAGFYAYYVPDMSYDAFELKSGKWILKEDVVAINGKQADKRTIRTPDANGEMREVKMKNKWIDPSDAGSPTGGNNHTADLPEGEKDKKSNAKKTKPTKVKKTKDKRDPSNQYPYSDLGKKSRKRKK